MPMSGEHSGGHAEQHEAIDARLTDVEADIEALQDQDERANDRAGESESRADEDRQRLGDLEERVNVDREMIAELQAEGLISTKHAANLEEALHTSRRIGAAIGIIMGQRGVSETAALELLKRASMDTNQKLRVLADEVVLTGDVSLLRHL